MVQKILFTKSTPSSSS